MDRRQAQEVTVPKDVTDPVRDLQETPDTVTTTDVQDMDTNQQAEKFQFRNTNQTESTPTTSTDSNHQPKPRNQGANRYDKDELSNKVSKDFSQGGRAQIRLTKHGLLFSGPTAFPSNMYKRIFYDNDQAKCYSVEQRYGFLEAMFNKEFDLALALTSPDLNRYQVKDMCRHLPKIPAWNAIRVPTLKRLMIKKFQQNPDLNCRT